MRPGEHVEEMFIRFRTLGDLTISGAIASTATTLEEVIMEVAIADHAERGNRADDQGSESSMEDRKREGYF